VPLPPDLTTIVLTGTYADASGAPLTGQVIIYVPQVVRDSTGKVILGAGPVSCPLGPAGSFTVTLACTDNPNLNPTGFTYTVLEQIPGLGRSYSISLPHTLGPTADLSALAP
jgi:hypothetical protein